MAASVGVSKAVGWWWFGEAGGVCVRVIVRSIGSDRQLRARDRCRAHKRDRVDRTVRDNSATVLALADNADTAVQALARQMISEIEAWIPGLPNICATSPN